MSQAAVIADIRRSLRISLITDDATERAELAALVAALGHRVVEADPDLVLTYKRDVRSATAPVVTIGAAECEQAGLLPRDATPAQIEAALHAAANGLVVRPARDRGEFEELSDGESQPLLTPRETEVLAKIADGLSNKEIARQLAISLHTVKFHVESLLRKLGARSRAEAVAKAVNRRNLEL